MAMAPPPLQVDAYDQQHVAAVAFPFATHSSPMLATVRRLAKASPNTLFSFFSTSQSNNSLFSNIAKNTLPRNIKVYDVADGVPDGYVFVGKPQEDIELFMNAAPRNLRASFDAAAADTGKKISCLITDAFLWFGAHLADDLGARWVPFWMSGLNSLSTHVHTDLLRDTLGTGQSIAGHENELINVNIPGLSKVRIKDLQEGVIFGNLDSVFSRMLHQMGRLLPRATAVFMNCFEELDITVTNDLKSKFNKLLNVGPSDLASPLPPLKVDATGCLSFLDEQKAASSVVYVSFGSVAMPPEKELMAIAEALEVTGVPFIWSLKNNFKTPLLNEFLTSKSSKLNGIVVPWAPQPHILAHGSVGAFVTHCGWNSLLETIAGGGVPMICRPFFGDHRLNARMVEDALEIGVTVEGGFFTKDGLVKSLEIVLSQDRGSKMRDNVKKIKQVGLEAVGPKGSSTKNFKLLLDVISGST